MGVYEPTAFTIVAGTTLLLLCLHFLTRRHARLALNLKWRHILAFALATFVFCYYGSKLLHLGFPLSVDEFVAAFQARIFASGHMTASVPQNLLDLRPALMPQLVMPWGDNRVIEVYLPVHSALLAVGTFLFGTPWVVNPISAACSLLLVFAVGRNLRLDPSLPGWAVVLIATSSQFLLMSVSSWAMPSHLLFNLAWLYFYTHPDKRLYYLAPPLGILAIGLHQPICHVLFVLPFLLRLLLDRRWLAAAYSAIIYLLGGLFWVHWILSVQPDTQTVAQRVMGLPDLRGAFIFYLSLLLTLSWQNVLMSVLLIGAVFQVRQMPSFFRDLALGVALTLAFYLFFNQPQANGWGYRYIYPVLGNLVLIAAWMASRTQISVLTFAAMMLIALGVQLPFRCHEVREVSSPVEQAYDTLSHLDADFVIIDHRHGWFSEELMRNSPDFDNRPIMLYRGPLTDAQFHDLLDKHKAVFISTKEFERLGIPVVKSSPPP